MNLNPPSPLLEKTIIFFYFLADKSHEKEKTTVQDLGGQMIREEGREAPPPSL